LSGLLNTPTGEAGETGVGSFGKDANWNAKDWGYEGDYNVTPATFRSEHMSELYGNQGLDRYGRVVSPNAYDVTRVDPTIAEDYLNKIGYGNTYGKYYKQGMLPEGFTGFEEGYTQDLDSILNQFNPNADIGQAYMDTLPKYDYSKMVAGTDLGQSYLSGLPEFPYDLGLEGFEDQYANYYKGDYSEDFGKNFERDFGSDYAPGIKEINRQIMEDYYGNQVYGNPFGTGDYTVGGGDYYIGGNPFEDLWGIDWNQYNGGPVGNQPWDTIQKYTDWIPKVLSPVASIAGTGTGGTGATGGSSTSTQYPSGSSSGGAAYTTSEGSSGSATGSAGREAGLASLKKIAAIQALQDAINKKFSGPLYYT
jgi:hypothetical protein